MHSWHLALINAHINVDIVIRDTSPWCVCLCTKSLRKIMHREKNIYYFTIYKVSVLFRDIFAAQFRVNNCLKIFCGINYVFLITTISIVATLLKLRSTTCEWVKALNRAIHNWRGLAYNCCHYQQNSKKQTVHFTET